MIATLAAVAVSVAAVWVAVAYLARRYREWTARRRAADAAIDAFLRARFAGADRAVREVHGLTVPQLLDLADTEIELGCDADFRATTDQLLTQFPDQT